MNNIDLQDACLSEAQRRGRREPLTPQKLIDQVYSDFIHCPQECKPAFYNTMNCLLGEEVARIVMQQIVSLQ